MIWRFGDLEMDTASFELRRDGDLVPVEPQVFDVLAHLVAHRDRVVSKGELLDEVWGDRFVSESALTSRIKAARRAVGDDGRTQSVIRTHHGRGYRFVASVSEVPTAPPTEAPGAPPAPSPSVGEPAVARHDPEPSPSSPPTSPSAGLVRTRYARSSGFEIAYQVTGSGPDVIFIPGFVSNLDLHGEHPAFTSFFDRLRSFSRLTLFDKRGTGCSQRLPPGQLPTLEQRMDDVRAVLDATGVHRTTLFGISEGGPMSLLFAATYPERVDRLVLYGAFANDPFPEPVRFARLARRLWGKGSVLRILAPSWGSSDADREFLARFERLSATPEAAAALVTMAAETDARSTLGAIEAPTLVLHRAHDAIIPFDRAQVMAAGIAGAELVSLPGSDHLACMDPGTMIDHVERFVTGVPPATVGQRVLTTMLLVDVVGSTERAAQLGDARWAAVLADLFARADRALAAAGGTCVGTTGDGLLATFDGPARAVRCALALSQELEQQGTTVRCGVHTSEVERRGEDISGIGVHVTARVEALASPGEVLVTRTVRDLVAGSGLDFAPRGTHELRGVPDRWELFAASD